MPNFLIEWAENVQLQPPDIDSSAWVFGSKISAPVVTRDLNKYKGTHTFWLFVLVQQAGLVICYKVPPAAYDFISNMNVAETMPITSQTVLLVPNGMATYADIPIESFEGNSDVWRIPQSFFNQ